MTIQRTLPVVDRRSRPLRDLRVSVTDKCNFRCPYCMPRDVFGQSYRFLPKADVLSFEEMARTVRVFADLGVRKVRLTGGEPLLRRGLPTFVAMLAPIPELDLALTTNGSLLARDAGALAAAGLHRVTVSLDSLDPVVFQRMSDTTVSVADVLEGIDAAVSAGLRPVKVNAVVRRSVNDADVLSLARRFRGTGVVLRFIEFMDVGATNHWSPRDVVPSAEIVARIDREMPLEPVPSGAPSDDAPWKSPAGEVARRYRYRDGSGEIGVIASVTQPFCGGCTRARISADGQLYTCLFANRGVDLRGLLRSGTDDATLRDVIAATWNARDDRYSEIRATAQASSPKVEMSYIGG